MKKNLFKMLSLVTAVLFAMSCNKDDGNDINTVTNNPITISTPNESAQAAVEKEEELSIPFAIEVGQDASLSKVGVVEEDGKLYQVFYKYGDEIEVTGKDIYGTLTMSDKTVSVSAKNAFFKGTLYGKGVQSIIDGTLTQLQLSIGTELTEPKQCKSNATLDDAFIAYGYCTAPYEFAYYETDHDKAYFTQQTAFLRFNIGFYTSVNIKVPGSSEYTTFNIPANRTSIIAVPNGSTVKASFLSEEKTIDVSDGKVVYNITRSLPAGCIPASFSISENEQVLFSESNLLYGLSEGDLKLVGLGQHTIGAFRDGTAITEDYANQSRGYADLFGWGTWVADHKGSTTPKSTSTTKTYYWTNTDQFGYTESRAPADGFIDNWFILTKDEWEYLLNTRPMANPNGLRYVRASIKDGDQMIPGLILFPDAEELSTETNIAAAFNACGGVVSPYTDSFENYIEKSKWDEFALMWFSLPSYNGLVFLPAAGSRDGTTIKYNSTGNNVAGFYWTSKPTNGFPYAMVFDKTEVKLTNGTFCFQSITKPLGCSVRLIHAMPTTKN